MKRELVIPLLLLSSCLFFGSPASVAASDKDSSDWTTLDTVLQISYAVVHVADWKQTHKIQQIGHKDSNPYLGKHPSQGKIDRYFSTTLIGHTLVAYLLPKPYRNMFQIGTLGMELIVVKHNYNAGIRVAF